MTSYHPTKRDQEITDRNDILRLLKFSKFMTIALANKDTPYILTLSYGYAEEENAAYFHCSPSGMKGGFLRANPEVCATVIQDHGYLMGQCEHEYESLVIRGRMEILTAKEDKKKGMDALMGHLEYRPDPIRDRNIESDEVYARLMILRLRIRDIVGKKSRDFAPTRT